MLCVKAPIDRMVSRWPGSTAGSHLLLSLQIIQFNGLIYFTSQGSVLWPLGASDDSQRMLLSLAVILTCSIGIFFEFMVVLFVRLLPE